MDFHCCLGIGLLLALIRANCVSLWLYFRFVFKNDWGITIFEEACVHQGLTSHDQEPMVTHRMSCLWFLLFVVDLGCRAVHLKMEICEIVVHKHPCVYVHTYFKDGDRQVNEDTCSRIANHKHPCVHVHIYSVHKLSPFSSLLTMLHPSIITDKGVDLRALRV